MVKKYVLDGDMEDHDVSDYCPDTMNYAGLLCEHSIGPTSIARI